ncbi:MAG TPA: class I SAM-dependent methyltransferase, partial [Candidatus Fraserbacteria bacterium]|nr:class I SAM-dependent methyltransferase [Candidatus Fraserbacteria bacterium]
MTQASRTEEERSAAQVRPVLQRLLEAIQPREFAVRLWTGETLDPELGCPARFTLVLNHPGALGRMLWPPSDLTVGEAFVRGDFDIEGDLIAAFSLSENFTYRPFGWREGLRLLHALRKTARATPSTPLGREAVRLHGAHHSKLRDQAAVRYHYDVGNDFYALWLDRRMVYSCAYFPTGSETLETAQEAKLEHICRKLRLQPGDRLLDIGCGWGGLLTYAAERYGVQAVGVTLSPSQVEWARARIAELGLADRCRVELTDYRDLDEKPFDKLVSVGMFEHVGAA